MKEEKKKDHSLPFSQQEGIKPIKIKTQKDSINQRLKTRLWNAVIQVHQMELDMEQSKIQRFQV